MMSLQPALLSRTGRQGELWDSLCLETCSEIAVDTSQAWPIPSCLSRTCLEPTSKGLGGALPRASHQKGAVNGETHPSSPLFLENGQKMKSCSGGSEFPPAWGEAGAGRGARAVPVPREAHGEVGHTPLGRGSCFEGRRKGHGRGGQGCTVGPANRNPLYKQGEDPTEIRDGFSFKKIKHLKHLRTHALTPWTVINFFLCRAWSTFQKQS